MPRQQQICRQSLRDKTLWRMILFNWSCQYFVLIFLYLALNSAKFEKWTYRRCGYCLLISVFFSEEKDNIVWANSWSSLNLTRRKMQYATLWKHLSSLQTCLMLLWQTLGNHQHLITPNLLVAQDRWETENAIYCCVVLHSWYRQSFSSIIFNH